MGRPQGWYRSISGFPVFRAGQVLATLRLAGLKNACYFRALEGFTGHCVCWEQALCKCLHRVHAYLVSALCCFLSLASKTNVWIFAWLMRSYIRKASVGNIYKQANFLNENVLWISFLRIKKLLSWPLILILAVHSEVLFTLTPLLSSEKN